LYKTPHGKAPPPPKPFPAVTATKSAAPSGELGDNPSAPPENSPPENANIRGKWIEEHKCPDYFNCIFSELLKTIWNFLSSTPPGSAVFSDLSRIYFRLVMRTTTYRMIS
jgi:hypothetical protein